MDPNAALKNIRASVAKIQQFEWDDSTRAPLATVLAEQVKDLDEWLSRGGYRPDPWLGHVGEQHDKRAEAVGAAHGRIVDREITIPEGLGLCWDSGSRSAQAYAYSRGAMDASVAIAENQVEGS